MITGIPKVDGIAVGTVAIDFLVARPEAGISVKAAFVDSKTGRTHGWTQAGGTHGGPPWSMKVQEKAHELRILLEEDLALRHFHSTTETPETEEEPGGIGEHAGVEADQG